MSVTESQGDPVGDLAFLHEEMIASGGSVLEVIFTKPDSLLTGGISRATVVDVVWSASDEPPHAGMALEVTTPKGLVNTRPQGATIRGFVAVLGNTETISAGVVGPDGDFIVPDNDAQLLPMAANALSRDGIPQLPASPAHVRGRARGGPERWDGDAVGALREYFTQFADASYLELTKDTQD